MTRKFYIDSFFIDYYDHWFDSRYDQGVEAWHRHGNLPPYKDEAFQLMWNEGIDTPWFGKAGLTKKLLGPRAAEWDVVVYDDLTAHAARGKRKTPLLEAPDDAFISEFVHITGEKPTHTRIVHIGTQYVEFTMTSNDHPWMSNSGDVNMQLVSYGNSLLDTAGMMGPTLEHRVFDYPLYAIDYVYEKRRGYLAVDLNRCPGLSNTPVEDVFDAREAAELIIEYAQMYDFNGIER